MATFAGIDLQQLQRKAGTGNSRSQAMYQMKEDPRVRESLEKILNIKAGG